MIFKRILLENEGPEVYLDAYIADKTAGFTRDAVLVIPGGGYAGVCTEREGEPVAMAFMPYGYNAFVLKYSVRKDGHAFPAQLVQASKAMKHIRDNAEEYGINPNRVFATGFSAGGHLTASLGILWNLPEVYKAAPMEYGYNRPTGIMPIYPVISSDPAFGHIDSIHNLWCCDEPTAEQNFKASLEKHVSKDSSPAFIMHTSNDNIVNIKNALALAAAYADAGLTFELHVFPDAPHGIALANKITMDNCEKFDNSRIAEWVRLAAEWAKTV